NYEAATSHSITIRATSADGSFTIQSFAINLTDVDEYDVSAVSDINSAANSVAENAAAGTTVGLTAFAADSDATNNTITYTLTDNDGGRFAIDSSTGAVTTTRGLDRELDGAVRQVTIRATSADGSWSEETFTIDIQDQDEFDVTTPADVNSSPNFVAENSAAGSAVGITAQAADIDATNNLVSYSLTNNDGGRFAIDPVSGVVTTTRTLDREVDGAQRQVTVRATSADGSFAEQNFTIDIGDLDEFDVTAPADVNAASNFVAENSPAGSLVGITAQAADSDSTNNLVTYSLSNNDGGRFAIDPVSGVVTTTRALDREIDGASRQITIRSTSADGSTAEQVFTISIGDVDEADVTVPVDVNPSANQVNENAAIGSAVGLTISAQDSDATQSLVSYQLLDNAGGRFAIDALTGVVTVAGPLDYETATTHSILVRAISQDGSVANQYFTINVLPLNDNTPQFVSPTSYTVGENQLNVGFVSGTDADLPGQALSYTISGGADAAKFVLDPTSGQLQFAGLQDFEAPGDANSNGVYEVRIRVSDGQLWSEQLVLVTVADENDQPVVISDSWSMDEDTMLSQSVLANDSDQDGDPLSVQLLEGPANASSFVLNSDGTFSYRPSENWYGTDGFRYRISDGRGGTAEGSVTLQVQPVNDAPISLENAFTVLQGSTLETATGVLSNDMDIESEPLIAILVAPPTRGVITFRIDGSFLYKPEVGFIGTDSFTYIASDGVMSGTPTNVWVQVDVGSGLPPTPPPPPPSFGGSGNSGGSSSGGAGSSSGDSSSGSGNSDTGNSDSSGSSDSSGADNSSASADGVSSTGVGPQAGQAQTG
ncbi:MAG: cadherin domain-containing protein, partial [Planctomycetota bacterium]